MPNLEEIWKEICQHFKPLYEVTSFDTWFKTVVPVQLHESTLVLQVPSTLHENYWKAKLLPTVEEHLEETYHHHYQVMLITEGQQRPFAESTDSSPKKPELINFDHSTHLNPAYNFESFVVGPGNMMAHAAALAVSEEPGTLYNPLYFYGGVGLGKTHLMHAIGHQLLKSNPNAKVKYVSSETFTNDFVNSIKTKQQEEFRKAYRNVDLLLVDDVQFFANKVGTIDEFFYTFSDLYDSKKQIVISSDRMPNEIENLGDRLISRFRWGLVVDITPPDYDTRVEILRKKSLAEGFELPEDALGYLAGQFESNVRELEGGLTRVRAFSQLKDEPITASLVTEALGNLSNEPQTKTENTELKANSILAAVSKYYDVSITDLKGKKRLKRIVVPRQIAMYLMRELTSISLPKIGKEFGGKDHTTVLHACDKIGELIRSDSQINKEVAELKKSLS